jgi:hypothetical protein
MEVGLALCCATLAVYHRPKGYAQGESQSWRAWGESVIEGMARVMQLMMRRSRAVYGESHAAHDVEESYRVWLQ